MSDYEEPAAKISKIETRHKDHDTDEMDEGHEEWLSEGILTDDDYNPAADHDTTVNTSQEALESLADETETVEDNTENTVNETANKTEQIEQTVNDLQNSHQTEFPEELGAFLIRKTDGKVIDTKKDESELDDSTKYSDDGHSTDELLRMLGEDNSKRDKVKKPEPKRIQESQSSDDDDEYIFEGAKVSRLKVAKSVLMKKYPSKAVPEDMSDKDSDMSSDEGLTVKRMFGVTKKVNAKSSPRLATVNTSTSKGTSRPAAASRPGSVAASKGSNTSASVSKGTSRPATINALRTVTNKVVSIGKSAASEKSSVTSTALPKPLAKTQPHPDRRRESDEVEEEESLDEEQYEMDEDMASESSGLRLMRPERMDEEAPSDQDSCSDNESLYDELPSSDSEDLNEWFTLDVRQERAGDYIPLLGEKAHQLLLAEKQRVSTRLSALKQSVSALSESSSQQADMLRRATLQLAELDAQLKA